jgi:hypothetical protein
MLSVSISSVMLCVYRAPHYGALVCRPLGALTALALIAANGSARSRQYHDLLRPEWSARGLDGPANAPVDRSRVQFQEVIAAEAIPSERDRRFQRQI